MAAWMSASMRAVCRLREVQVGHELGMSPTRTMVRAAGPGGLPQGGVGAGLRREGGPLEPEGPVGAGRPPVYAAPGSPGPELGPGPEG